MIAFFQKWLCRTVYGTYCIITTSLLLFTIFEVYPGLLDLVNLQGLKYYAVKTRYLPDSSLVFVPRRTGYTLTSVSNPEIEYVASYTDAGFRVNSSSPPYQVLFVGDSYIEIGDEAGTLSERLGAESGLSTFNLGRGWYGPYQYLELFRRYGLALKPRYAIFCFFAGNDIYDIKEYERWRAEGMYHFYKGELSKGFLKRYIIALSETLSYLLEQGRIFWRQVHELQSRLMNDSERSFQGSEIDRRLGVIRVGEEEVRMKFVYWNQEGSAQQLLASREWRTLRSLLADFGQLCRDNSIEPILVYIPSKIQVYDEYSTENSGQEFKRNLEKHYPYRDNAPEAITILSKELDLSLVNLLPYFKRLTEEGHLLYHPFDTHWNNKGIHAAAKFIAMSLDWTKAGKGTPATALKRRLAPRS